MIRLLALAGVAGLSAGASAQIPNVLFKADVILHYRSEQGKRTTFKAYDSLGNYSTVGLQFTLEPGFEVIVTQRLQQIRGNADNDQIHELYIEDRGYWRLGKQVLPFGQNRLLRESVYAGRYETVLGFESLPAVLSVCDGGQGRQRGFVGRVGTRLGVSGAFGNHFGIDASSLTTVRRPEDSPGKNRGYKQIVGVDYSRDFGKLRAHAEHAWFRSGETPMDPAKEVFDVTLSYAPDSSRWILFGWSRDTELEEDTFRVQSSIQASENAWIEPILQMSKGEVRSFGASVRVRF